MSMKHLSEEERKAYFRTHKRLSRAKLRGELTSEEMKAKNREQYLKNKERYKKKAAAWNKKHGEYMRAQSIQNRVKKHYPDKLEASEITLESMEKWLEDHRHMPCTYCGTHLSNTVDHVIPLSGDGTHSFDNMVMCCRSCNTWKADRTLEEFGERIRQMNKLINGQRNQVDSCVV